MRHDEHYSKLSIEPMEYCLRNNLDPAQQTIIKYITRYRDKGGIRDLEAALDFLADYIDYVRTGDWKGNVTSKSEENKASDESEGSGPKGRLLPKGKPFSPHPVGFYVTEEGVPSYEKASEE